MNINSEIVLDNIKKIRKLQKRSIHDCAAFLNISRSSYLKFEQGQTSLSLPEIELLAHYFGVPVGILFQPDLDETASLPLLDKEIHPGYTQLRNKMICAQLNISLAEQNLDLSQLHETTQIPLESLKAYFDASQPVPSSSRTMNRKNKTALTNMPLPITLCCKPSSKCQFRIKPKSLKRSCKSSKRTNTISISRPSELLKVEQNGTKPPVY